MKADDLCFHEHLKSFNSTDSSPGHRGKRDHAKKRTHFIRKIYNIKKQKEDGLLVLKKAQNILVLLKNVVGL